MKKTLFFVIIFACCLTGLAQKQVYEMPLDSNIKLSGNAFCYMLPTTTIKVEVSIIKVREIKGYYADDAEKMLGLTNVITNNRTFYKLKDVHICTQTEPDPTHAYAIEPSGKQLKNNTLTNSFIKRNIQKEPIILAESYSTQVAQIPNFFKNYANVSYTETEDSFVETKIINGVVTQVPANRTKLVNKTASQKVQEAADRITQIRKERNSLIAGEQEVAYTKDALELMINQLNQAENDYLDLFRGISLEDEIHYTFFITPNGNESSLPIFSLDPNYGFATPATEDGIVYFLSFTPTTANAVSLPVDEKKSNNGYRVRTTQAVRISLTQGNFRHDFGIYPMYQWGRINTLPANLDTAIENIGFIY